MIEFLVGVIVGILLSTVSCILYIKNRGAF